MNRLPIEIASGDMEIRFRDCFSVRYIQSAAILCRLGYAIEKEFEKTGEVSPESALSHEAFILNSVLSSVAFLESAINELYSDASDNATLSPDEENAVLFRKIAEGWHNEKNFDRAPLLTRYQKILTLTGNQPFSESDPAFANVKNLIAIRNFLMHYRREWVVLANRRVRWGQGETQGEKFEPILRHAFCENPLAGKNLPFFPDRCLGHGCAEWAVLNSLILTDTFFENLGIAAPYEGIRKDLGTR